MNDSDAPNKSHKAPEGDSHPTVSRRFICPVTVCGWEQDLPRGDWRASCPQEPFVRESSDLKDSTNDVPSIKGGPKSDLPREGQGHCKHPADCRASAEQELDWRGRENKQSKMAFDLGQLGEWGVPSLVTQ